MGLQELLIHFHPFFAIVVIPLTVLIAACWLPFVKLNDANQGIWFISDKGIRSAIFALASGFAMTLLFIGLSELLPDPEALFPAIPPLITTGFIPFVILIVTLYLILGFMRRKYTLERSEYIQAVIITLIVSYSVLTVTGIFFRGEGMKLMWPWQV
jgi:hypothetical protein